MEINDQLSRYQAEYYVENAHDAFVNVQRLLNDYNAKINCITDSIEEEKTYRRRTRRQRMKKFGAVVLLLLGLIHVLVTIALLAFTGYLGYTYFTSSIIPMVHEYYKLAYNFVSNYLPFDTLYIFIGGCVAYLIFLIITCKIFSRRRKVGRRLNIKKAKKILKKKIKRAEALTAVLTTYPIIYEEINKTLIRTKRHPLGKILINEEDKKAIDLVKSFVASSEEATKLYNLKEN